MKKLTLSEEWMEVEGRRVGQEEGRGGNRDSYAK